MVPDSFFERVLSGILRYRVHILVFLLTLFIALTISHPIMELNDEWITLNQLNQLHKGHQVIVNEGKYGLLENGTPSPYFIKKSNLLGYSVALPLISLPAFWIIDFTDKHFPFFIQFFWAFLGMLILLFVNTFFQKYSYYKKWRLTTPLFLIIFAMFFLNLYFYISFPVTGPDTFPEIIAIVFTHSFLLAFIAVMIYEINNSIFSDAEYSFFGTVLILSCSSYFIWMVGGKDHILTVFVFTTVLLCLVKYQELHSYWYLPLTFIFSGILAWVRPELAFWVFLALCLFSLFIINNLRKQKDKIQDLVMIACAPFFTLIGALPFFTNNYMVTKNFFIPAWILWNQDFIAPSESTQLANGLIPQGGVTTAHSLFSLFGEMTIIQPATLFPDLFGVFLYPKNGSMGVLLLVPLFLVLLIPVVILYLNKKIQFTHQERNWIVLLTLVCFSIFITYGVKLNSLNTSIGVFPDIRYLTPIYIPLSIIGLIFLKKIKILTISPMATLKRMIFIWICALPLSLILVYLNFSEYQTRSVFVIPLDKFFSFLIITVCLVTIIFILLQFYSNIKLQITNYSIPLLCALPLVWQIDIVFWVRSHVAAAGYVFWIPIIRLIHEYFLSPLLIS